jgi:hypothetical protein
MKLEEIKHLKEKTFLKISTNQLIPKLINEIFYFIIGLSLFFLILYKFFPNFYREIIEFETNNNINFYLKNNDRNITDMEFLLQKYISMVEK